MAQGQDWDKEKIIRILEPNLKLGCSLKKACEYAGIPYTTVHTWVSDDDTLRIQITAWQNELNLAARKTIARALRKSGASVSTAFEWLGKKEKDEFSERKELTGANGDPLFTDEHREKSNKAIGEFLEGDQANT